jgi:hypothetical protein
VRGARIAKDSDYFPMSVYFSPRYEKTVLLLHVKCFKLQQPGTKATSSFDISDHDDTSFHTARSSEFYHVLLPKCLWSSPGWLIDLILFFPSGCD